MAALFLLAACGFGSLTTSSEDLPYEPFIPPTIVPTALPTDTPSPTQPVPAGSTEINTVTTGSELPGTDCSNNLTFISDVTIPDGTVVVAGSTLDKQWEVENSGGCNWEEGYQIQLISGEDMGVDLVQSLIPARSGSRVTIRIVFTAPEEPGDYRSAWQAYNPQGNAFGDPFYIDITVE